MIPAAHVVFVLDDSGSMEEYEHITAQAFDAMVESLQLCKGADIVMTLIKYGNYYQCVYSRKHIQLVKPIEYSPCQAGTAIYDSLLRAIDSIKSPPREEKTIIIMQTDGGDNESRHSKREVERAVLLAKSAGVEFLFMDAAEGVYVNSEELGFTKAETIHYSAADSLAAFAEVATDIGSVASRLKDRVGFK